MPDDKKYYESNLVFEFFDKEALGNAIAWVDLKDGAFATQEEFTATESIFFEAYKAGELVLVARPTFQKNKTAGKSLRDRFTKS